jgi:glycine dehydrogenase subunit 1
MVGHPLLPNLDDNIVAEMLKKVGVSSISELFSDIPENFILKRRLRIPEGKSESTISREVYEKLAKNHTPPEALCFLGGGVWPHYIPAAIDSIVSRQEFYTSYTPYQPEVSQGILQALFEYQSLMCDILGMEVTNSSMYDWASAAGEAVRMVAKITRRSVFLVSSNIGPERLSVIRTYVEPLGLELKEIEFDKRSGELELASLESALSNKVAGIYFENPNYFGVIEGRVGEIVDSVHRVGGLAVVGVDPISLAVIKEPGSYGADIAIGEGQPLGIPMNYGGPHIGIFAVSNLNLARSMPGRLIGMTTVKNSSDRAFCMVLQTREQHIRREGATSNICTNQSLMAVSVASYLALLGKKGFKRLGEVILANSHYAAERIARIDGVKAPLFTGSFFKEFVAGYRVSASKVFEELAKRGIFAGYPLSTHFKGIGEAGSYCITEVHTSSDIERLARTLEEVL